MTFTKGTLTFLRDLKKDNTSEWFKENRPRYDEHVYAPSLDFAQGVLAHCAKLGLPFRGEPKKCLFRVNRDIRFSKDKSPYKTHIGITFTPTGEKQAFGVGYFHIEPKEIFVAGGFWCPEPPELKRFREAIARKPDLFLAAAKDVTKAGYTMECEPGFLLKRLPKGYESQAETPQAEYLKWKSFTASMPMSAEDLLSPKLAQEVAKKLAKLLPLLEFGWKNVAPPRPRGG